MFQRYAAWIHRYRFLVIVLWIVGAVASSLFLPKLQSVVAHQSTQFLPKNSPIIAAQNALNTINPSHKSKSSAVIAVHNKNGLTAVDKTYFDNQLKQLANHQSTYGIDDVQGAYNASSSVKSKFESKDGTVEIATVGFPHQSMDQQTSDALSKVKKVFTNPPKDASVLFTGDVPIQTDQVKISLNGASKTAGVTVALVLIILLIVFRSIVTPLITLLSIGLSFLITGNVVGGLAKLGLPVSTFTNTFLIAIIFGAGTDYSIIILNRFREEIGHGHTPIEAVASALRGVTKTVVFSALTVFVSFAILYFAHFGLYRTAVGVAVGILITLIACLTFIPALILALGRFVFWPRKLGTGEAHKPSKVWSATGRVALRYPWWTWVCVCLVLLPIGMLFTNKRTFDPMSDIPTAPSVNGFHTVSKAFGPGQVMPMDIVIQSPDNLRSSQGLATIENVSQAVAHLGSVQEVDSATRPTGKLITQFQLASQNKQVASGLGKVTNGLNTMAKQFGQVAGGSGSTKPLVDGANQVQSGANGLHQGLLQAATQTGQLSQGATKLQQGLAQLVNGQKQLSSGLQQNAAATSSLANGIGKAAAGSKNVSDGAGKLASSETQLATTASQLANAIAQWTKSHPANTSNPAWAQIVQLANATSQGTSQAKAAAGQLSSGATQVTGALTSLQSGANKLSSGASQLASSQEKLTSGSQASLNGAAQVASGTGKLQTGLQSLANGAGSLSSGAGQVAQGVQTLGTSLDQLSSGTAKTVKGLNQLSSGVQSAQSALNKSAQATTIGNPGFYIPPSTVQSNSDLKQAMNAYISPNGHVADIKVMLNLNPYSMAAIQQVPIIKQQAESAFIQSPIHDGQIQLAGTTPTQADINRISTADFTRTMTLVLAAIFVLLVAMLGSVIAPLYIILSLGGTYFVTMGILQTIAVHVLGKSGISWSVPFFAFLLLVALGVDYCIFLMTRFEEEVHRNEGITIVGAMHKAMASMGNVIFSAAAIMAGTFGSMAVAGVTSLVEIGLTIIIGLAFYTFILLAFFIPASAAIFGRGHFWPFRKQPRLQDDEEAKVLDGQLGRA